MKKLIAVLLAFITAGCSYAQVRLPQLIRDSMILQRDVSVNVWGWAAANEKVTVRLKGKLFKTKADAAGNWKVQLPSQKAGGPHNIQIIASNNITISNVLFGDVWFCSGQSNMVHQLNIHDVKYADEISHANFPEIRQFLIPTLANLQAPQQDLPAGYWNAAVGENVRPFSAVAYFFAKQLYQKYHVPIGIINASVGGTPIETWTSEDGLKDIALAQQIMQKNKDTG